MKSLLLVATTLLFASCAATKPIRKPIGLGALAVGSAIVHVAVAPVEKVQDSTMNDALKIPLYVVTYPISLVGGTLGMGFVVGSVIIYPEWMN